MAETKLKVILKAEELAEHVKELLTIEDRI